MRKAPGRNPGLTHRKVVQNMTPASLAAERALTKIPAQPDHHLWCVDVTHAGRLMDIVFRQLEQGSIDPVLYLLHRENRVTYKSLAAFAGKVLTAYGHPMPRPDFALLSRRIKAIGDDEMAVWYRRSWGDLEANAKTSAPPFHGHANIDRFLRASAILRWLITAADLAGTADTVLAEPTPPSMLVQLDRLFSEAS